MKYVHNTIIDENGDKVVEVEFKVEWYDVLIMVAISTAIIYWDDLVTVFA